MSPDQILADENSFLSHFHFSWICKLLDFSANPKMSCISLYIRYENETYI